MSGKHCPSRDELFGYAVGALSDGDAESLMTHVTECPDCEATLLSLNDAEDTLVGRLRSPAVDDPFLEESRCREAVSEAKAVAAGAITTGDKPAAEAPTEFDDLGRIGEYQLTRKIGQGGMGMVYQALHTKLRRTVALKVLSKSRMDDEKAVARFEREMAAVGQLDHPNIVSAVHAGEHQGTSYLVMEYVDGLDLSELVRRCGPLPVADACELIRQAAVGLQYAHQNGLVHRNVKPSNLMLTTDGRVKILDLGLALLHEDQPAAEEMTGTGQAMGTADYMAPEQTSDSHNVDIRADVYSLGGTLYKLLCGRAPYSGAEYRNSFEKMMGHVRDPLPSIAELRDGLPEKLVALIERMLAKDPEDRPATPGAVTEAVEPFARGTDLPQLIRWADAHAALPSGATEPVDGTAEYVSPAPAGSSPYAEYRRAQPSVRRWYRRPAVLVGLAAAAVLAFAAIFTVATNRGTLEIKTFDEDVEVPVLKGGREITILDTKTGYKLTLYAGEYQLKLSSEKGDLQLSTDTFKLRRGDKVIVEVRHKPAIGAAEPETVWPKSSSPRLYTISHKGELVRIDVVRKGFEKKVVKSLGTEFEAVEGLTITDGLLYAAANYADDESRLYAINVETAEVSARGSLRVRQMDGLAWSDGELLGVTSILGGAAAARLIYIDPQSGKTRPIGEPLKLRDLDSLTFDDRGRLLTTDGMGIVDMFYELDRRGISPPKSLAPTPAITASHDIEGLAMGADGMLYGVTHPDPTAGKVSYLVRINPQTFQHENLGSLGFGAMSITADRRRAENVSETVTPADKTVTAKLRATLSGHTSYLSSVAVSPDGKTLASGSFDQTVRLWDVKTGQMLATLTGHTKAVYSVAFSPDGKTLAACTMDGTVKLWDLAGGELKTTFGAPVWSLTFSPDGKILASGGKDGTVKLWQWDSQWESPEMRDELKGHAHEVHHVAFSPDGNLLASASEDKTVKLWDVATGSELATLSGHTEGLWSLAFTPDGKTLASASADKTIKLWDLRIATPAATEPKPADGDLPQPAGAAETIRSFGEVKTVNTITKDGLEVDQNAWRIKADKPRTVRLFEVPEPGVENCLLAYRAKIKTEDLEGRAYLEMWCRVAGMGEFFSKDLGHTVSGTTDWSSYETPFFLKKGQRPDLIKLNLAIEGKGTVWIKDVELLKTPLRDRDGVTAK